MAYILKDLLGNDHPLFVHNLMQLESASGNAGVDTRLIADILEKGHAVLRLIGLDPSDSHPKEVYQALVAKSKAGQSCLKINWPPTFPSAVPRSGMP